MITKNQVLIIVLVFITCIEKTYEIDCYSCMYDTCPIPFNASGILVRTRRSNSGWCLKIIKKEPQEMYQYKRGAATVNICSKNKCQVHPTAPESRFYCCCNTDLCNASQRIMSGITIFISVIVMIF